jgi:hypothetical protein
MYGRIIHLYCSAAAVIAVVGAVGSLTRAGASRGKTSEELDPKCIVHH